MKLKICGIKNIDDLEFCINNKVDYIGINFIKESKRYCKNGDILNHLDNVNLSKTKLIALFKNPKYEELKEIMNYDFYGMQFCGNEDKEILFRYREKFLIWKSVNLDNYKNYLRSCDVLLFDSSHGNGVLFDQKIPQVEGQFGIAGGINIDNIINMKNKYPKADFLDLASGVEEGGIFSKKKAKSVISLFYDRK